MLRLEEEQRRKDHERREEQRRKDEERQKEMRARSRPVSGEFASEDIIREVRDIHVCCVLLIVIPLGLSMPSDFIIACTLALTFFLLSYFLSSLMP